MTSRKRDLLKNLYYWQIEQISGYGHTRMYELLNLGCLEFEQKLKRLTDIDLLEYKETWYNINAGIYLHWLNECY